MSVLRSKGDEYITGIANTSGGDDNYDRICNIVETLEPLKQNETVKQVKRLKTNITTRRGYVKC